MENDEEMNGESSGRHSSSSSTDSSLDMYSENSYILDTIMEIQSSGSFACFRSDSIFLPPGIHLAGSQHISAPVSVEDT